MVWRPILSGVASLSEIEKEWNIDDLLDANEALDLKEDLEREAIEKSKPPSQGRR